MLQACFESQFFLRIWWVFLNPPAVAGIVWSLNHDCFHSYLSDSSVLTFDSVYFEILTASKNEPQKCKSSYNKTVVYATTQLFLLSQYSGSVPQWSTVIHVWLVVDDWDKSRFPGSANTSSLPFITQPVSHTHTVSLISAVGMLSQLWTWVFARLCGLKYSENFVRQ